MTKENEVKLKGVIKSVCRLDVESDFIDNILLDTHCNLIDTLGFDSLLIVELILEIENTFDFEFDMNSLDINELKFYDKLKFAIDNYIGE